MDLSIKSQMFENVVVRTCNCKILFPIIFGHVLELCSDHFSSWLCYPGGLNKDCTVWLEGARPLPIISIICL